MKLNEMYNSVGQRAGAFISSRTGRLSTAVGLGLGASSAAHAQTEPTDYGTVLNTNLTKIEAIWAAVAVIMIGVALVTVGVRFFKKAK